MHFDILRDDGRYLIGPGSTTTGAHPEHPYAGLPAALAAVKRYRLALNVFAPDSPNADAGFTFVARRA